MRSDLSLPLFSSLSPTFPPLEFHRFGGTFQIRAIRRSETDRIMLKHSTEEGPQPRSRRRETHSGWFGRDIIRHTINSSDFVRDAGGYFPKDIRWENIPTQEGKIPGQNARHKRCKKLGKRPRTKIPYGPDAWRAIPP